MARLNYNVDVSVFQSCYKQTKWNEIIDEFRLSGKRFAEVDLTDELHRYPVEERPKVVNARAASIRNNCKRRRVDVTTKTLDGKLYIVKASWLKELEEA